MLRWHSLANRLVRLSAMQCPRCHHENNADAKFCTNCGTRLEVECADCGASISPGDHFCSGCGARLQSASETGASHKNESGDARILPVDVSQLEAERREVTVLFADLSGFTHMSSQLDPEETHALLNRYFGVLDSIVGSHGGRIDKHIGDAAMAVFGAPISHGNDPQRAVYAALAIHSALASLSPPLIAHIGIANGTVVASGTGSDEHREYTVIGDSVNLAARLQDLAGPGETLVSSSVHDGVERFFKWLPVRETTIKGFSDPVAVWRLVGTEDGEARGQAFRFVGRESELAQFEGALDSCLRTRSGQVVLVRGEPGIGKSRLLVEFRLRALDRGAAFHTALVLDFGAGRGKDAIGALVRSLLDLPQESDEPARTAAAQRAITSGAIDENHRPFLYDLLDLSQPDELRSVYDAMDQHARAAGKQEALSRLVRSASRSSPVIIAIEDVHWADATTLSYLASLALTVAQCPSLLVITTRPDGDPLDRGWRASIRGVPLLTVDLAPLRPDDALRMAIGSSRIAADFAKSCVERAEGNPLFLEQLLRSASENRAGIVPGTVQSIVQARMDNLAPDDRRALQAASVLGQRFPPGGVRHLLGMPDYNCQKLIEHYLVRPDGGDLLFTHALIRDGVYASLVKARREALHRRAAEWYAERDLALHAEHLALAHDAQAAAAFVAAAAAETAAYHMDSALRLTERGLEIAEGADRHALLCLRGDLLRGLGEVQDSIDAFQESLGAATDGAALARSWIGLGEGLRVSGNYDAALKATREAEQAAGTTSPLLLAEIHHLRGNILFPSGNTDDCLREHELARQAALGAGSQEWEARALGGLGDASYLAGRMRTAFQYFQECVAKSERLGLGHTVVANRHMIGWTRLFLNELSEAVSDARAAADMAVRTGQSRAEMLSHLLMAAVQIELGQLDLSMKAADQGMAVANKLGAQNFVAQALGWKAKALITAGQDDDARRTLDDAIASARKAGMTFIGPYVLTLRGLLEREPIAREKFLAEADSLMAAGSVSHNYVFSYRDRIDGALKRGAWDEADIFADALETYAASEPLPWTSFFAARGRALARFGRGEHSVDLSEALSRLVDEARAIGFSMALPALEKALAEADRVTNSLSAREHRA